MNEAREQRKIDKELKRIERDWKLAEIDRRLDEMKADDPNFPPVHWTVRVFVWAFMIGSAWLSIYVCVAIIKAIWRFLT